MIKIFVITEDDGLDHKVVGAQYDLSQALKLIQETYENIDIENIEYSRNVDGASLWKISYHNIIDMEIHITKVSLI